MDIKKCSKCKEDKKTSEFTKNIKKKCGYNSYCKECRKIMCWVYSQVNKDKRARYYKNWRKKNPDTHKEYYKANKDVYKERNKKTYESNKDRAKDYQKQWRLKNAEKYKTYQKDYREKKKNDNKDLAD